MTKKFPENLMTLLRKNNTEGELPSLATKEFGHGLKISCDDVIASTNGTEETLINWGSHGSGEMNGLNGFSTKEMSFKWEPEDITPQSKPIETRVFEVLPGH